MDYPEKELRDFLIESYWKEGKSLWQIASDLDMKPPSLLYWFKKLGIRTRTINKAVKLWHKQRKEKGLE